MIPRTDTETRPEVAPVQLLMRSRADRYGNDRARGGPRNRLVVVRNGLPVRFYSPRKGAESNRELDREWLRDCRKCAD